MVIQLNHGMIDHLHIWKNDIHILIQSYTIFLKKQLMIFLSIYKFYIYFSNTIYKRTWNNCKMFYFYFEYCKIAGA